MVSITQAQLDHSHRLKTAVLRGSTPRVTAFADALCAERAVHHGKHNRVSVVYRQPHQHGRAQTAHLRLKPAH